MTEKTVKNQQSDRSVKLNDETIDTLDKRLPSGWMKKVMEITGRPITHKSLISQVKNGRKFNEEIINALFQVCEEHEEQIERINRVARGEAKSQILKP